MRSFGFGGDGTAEGSFLGVVIARFFQYFLRWVCSFLGGFQVGHLSTVAKGWRRFHALGAARELVGRQIHALDVGVVCVLQQNGVM